MSKGVTFFWVVVAGCDIFLGACEWVWHFSGLFWLGVTFFWVGVDDVGVCDIFLDGCGWS